MPILVNNRNSLVRMGHQSLRFQITYWGENPNSDLDWVIVASLTVSTPLTLQLPSLSTLTIFALLGRRTEYYY